MEKIEMPVTLTVTANPKICPDPTKYLTDPTCPQPPTCPDPTNPKCDCPDPTKYLTDPTCPQPPTC